MLVRHDEPLKARAMLDTVPHFAADHPKVIAMRVELARRLAFLDDGYAEFYEAGGAERELLVPDEQVDAVCSSLPRARALVAALSDQTGIDAEAA